MKNGMTGMDEYYRDIERRANALAEAADKFVGDVARDAGARIRVAMVSASSPSPAGSAPAIVTGNLVKSIRAEHELGTLRAVVRVGSNGKRGKAPHWHLLEFGTRKMAARPSIRPNALAAAVEGEQQLGTIIRAAVDGI